MSNSNVPATRQARAIAVDAEPIFDTAQFEHMARIAGMMASSSLLPDHLRVMVDQSGLVVPAGRRDNTPCFLDEKATMSNAFLIVNQARLFGGIDPFALAQSSYFVHGRLGYEGKLVQALIERRVGSMKFEYNAANPESEDFGITVTAWVPNSEPPREEMVYGTVKEWATRKNGALNQQWKGAAGARRMLHYRGTREWARLYAPGLVLGLMDEDDLDNLREDMRARQATPVNQRLAHNPLAADEPRDISQTGQRVEATITTSPTSTVTHDPATGEIVQGGAGQPANGGGQGEGTGEAAGAAAAGGGGQEAKTQTAKRLPRGFPQKVDIACMKLVEALDATALLKAWEEFAEPLIQQITSEGLPTPSIDRLKEAHDKRANNFATMAKANMPKDVAKEDRNKGPDLHPTADPIGDTPTASQIENPAPGEQGEDFSTLLARLKDEAAAAQNYEDLDDVLETILGDLDFPRDVQHQIDDIVTSRRKAIGDAIAAADGKPAAKPATEDFPGNDSIIGNGAPPDAAQIELMVDGWIGDMRKCRTVAELRKYNDETITPYVTGPYGKLIPSEMYDDAKYTFGTRLKLLTAKEKDGN